MRYKGNRKLRSSIKLMRCDFLVFFNILPKMLDLNSKTLKWSLLDKTAYDKPMTTISLTGSHALRDSLPPPPKCPNTASKVVRRSERRPASHQKEGFRKKNTETVRSGEKRRRKRRVLFSLIRKLSPRKICPELSDQESLGVG